MSEAAIYVISKTKHGDMWRGYQREGAPIISSWLDHSPEHLGEPSFRPNFWERAIHQISICTAVIAYRLPDENWDHAWPEYCFAMHLKKPIFEVGVDNFKRVHIKKCCDIIEAIGKASVSREGLPIPNPDVQCARTGGVCEYRTEAVPNDK